MLFNVKFVQHFRIQIKFIVLAFNIEPNLRLTHKANIQTSLMNITDEHVFAISDQTFIYEHSERIGPISYPIKSSKNTTKWNKNIKLLKLKENKWWKNSQRIVSDAQNVRIEIDYCENVRRTKIRPPHKYLNLFFTHYYNKWAKWLPLFRRLLNGAFLS